MPNGNAIRDDNNVPILVWESSVDSTETVAITVDPANGAILCET